MIRDTVQSCTFSEEKQAVISFYSLVDPEKKDLDSSVMSIIITRLQGINPDTHNVSFHGP